MPDVNPESSLLRYELERGRYAWGWSGVLRENFWAVGTGGRIDGTVRYSLKSLLRRVQLLFCFS